jgi:beta-ribofuranosylaminobenzene 5'-phosphate synthase
MSAEPADQAVFVEAPARLHFGVLDLRTSMRRWFGGIGAAAPAPTLLVSAEAADTLDAEGDDGDRAREFASRFLAHHRIQRGARVRVHRALPSHAGLGAGTQLGLAVARALAELFDLPTDAPGLARAVGRGRRSAIGLWVFEGGGLVVEGGRRPDRDECGPLVARLPFPVSWRCVVAVPHTGRGLSGGAEEEAFAQLPAPSAREVERVSHVVLMNLLPAVVEADLGAFGAALTEIQEITGRWFAPVQGGTFAPGESENLVRSMHQWGACGVGQSSWGPAVYGIVDGDVAGLQLAERVRPALGSKGAVYNGPFRTSGARVWRTKLEQSVRTR